MHRIDAAPFRIDTCPEAGIKRMDIGIGTTTAIACKIGGAQRIFFFLQNKVVGITHEIYIRLDLRGVEGKDVSIFMDHGEQKGIPILQVCKVYFEDPQGWVVT